MDFTFASPLPFERNWKCPVEEDVENEAPRHARASNSPGEQSKVLAAATGEASVIRMQRWMELTSKKGQSQEFSPSLLFKSPTGNNGAQEREGHFNRWMSATSQPEVTPLRAHQTRSALAQAQQPKPVTATAQAGSAEWQAWQPSPIGWAAAASGAVSNAGQLQQQQDDEEAMQQHGQYEHRDDHMAITPTPRLPMQRLDASMRMVPRDEASMALTTPMSGLVLARRGLGDDCPSDLSTDMSVAYSQISAAVGRLQLRHQHSKDVDLALGAAVAAQASPAWLRQMPNLTPGAGARDKAMDVSPAPIMLTAADAGGMQAPAFHDGVLVMMTAARPTAVHTVNQHTPTPPVEAVLCLMAAGSLPKEENEEVQPQQLLFEEPLGMEASAAAQHALSQSPWEQEDSSDDEFAEDELELISPLAGSALEAAMWRSASCNSSSSPLSDVLALMATPH